MLINQCLIKTLCCAIRFLIVSKLWWGFFVCKLASEALKLKEEINLVFCSVQDWSGEDAKTLIY